MIDDGLTSHCHVQRGHFGFALTKCDRADNLIAFVLKVEIGGQRGEVERNILAQLKLAQAGFQLVSAHLQRLCDKVNIGRVADCTLQTDGAERTAVIVCDGLTVLEGIGTAVIDVGIAYAVVENRTSGDDFKVGAWGKCRFIGVRQKQTGFLGVFRPIVLQIRLNKARC